MVGSYFLYNYFFFNCDAWKDTRLQKLKLLLQKLTKFSCILYFTSWCLIFQEIYLLHYGFLYHVSIPFMHINLYLYFDISHSCVDFDIMAQDPQLLSGFLAISNAKSWFILSLVWVAVPNIQFLWEYDCFILIFLCLLPAITSVYWALRVCAVSKFKLFYIFKYC